MPAPFSPRSRIAARLAAFDVRHGPTNSVAFTLTRYGGLFEDGSEAAVDRLDALLGGGSKDSDNVLQLDTRKPR